jgi:hypothetical protein
MLEHTAIKDFLLTLSPSTPLVSEDEIAKKFLSSSEDDRNDARAYQLKNFFVSRLSRQISALPPDNLKGFCYLFLFYWYQLFNNKEFIKDQEPGPKQFLGIMSRVPLSQLFDTLSLEEKGHFRSVFEPIIAEVGEAYKIIEYEDYDEKRVPPALTLGRWYQSLVEEVSRKVVNGRGVDLLSPPPGLEGDEIEYSMGIKDIRRDSSGFPLIEVRGYASIWPGGKRLTFDTFDSFVKEEARWFFGLFSGGDKK